MKLILAQDVEEHLAESLSQAGKREIGGVLMGEHVDRDTFRIVRATVQMQGGTFATFVRLLAQAIGPLRAFFAATRHEYTRYNYLGEWHSHHSFALRASSPDHRSMLEIVEDPEVGANFAVLLLVRLEDDALAVNATLYTVGGVQNAEVIFENRRSGSDDKPLVDGLA